MLSIKTSRLNVFNHRLRTLIAISLLTLPVAAYADCDTSISSSTLDYGQLNTKMALTAGKMSNLPEKNVNVIITCDEPKEIGLQFNASDARLAKFQFGEQGELKVMLTSLTRDNVSVDNIEKYDPGKSVINASGVEITPATEIMVPGKGKVFNFSLRVKPLLKDSIYAVRDDTEVTNSILLQVTER